MTKVQAIKKLMEDNEGLTSWSLIYDNIDKTFKKIDDGLFSLLSFQEDEYIKNDIFQITEKTSEIKTRIGQSYFRKSLLNSLKKCPFTNINNPKLLIASHIKPWAKSDNIERLDVKNGFIFTPTFDLLFDKGYISFNNNKSLIISEVLDINTITRLNLQKNQIISRLPINGRIEYLEYHRDIVLKRVG